MLKQTSDLKIVYEMVRKIPGYKFKLEESKTEPEAGSIWIESDVLATYIVLDGDKLLISDECRKHLDCDEYTPCETDFLVVKLAESDFVEHVECILFELSARREAIDKVRKDSFAILDRDIRIDKLEALLKKNKIRIPK